MGYGSNYDSSSDEEEVFPMDFLREREADDKAEFERMKNFKNKENFSWWKVVENIRDRFQPLSELNYTYVADTSPIPFFKLFYQTTADGSPRRCEIFAYMKVGSNPYRQQKIFSWNNILGSVYVHPIDEKYGSARGKRYTDDMPTDLIQIFLGYAHLDQISEKDDRVKTMEREKSNSKVQVTVDGYTF